MILRNLLNGGVAEVGDEYAQELIDSGGWAAADEAPAPRKRTPRTKVAPPDAAE